MQRLPASAGIAIGPILFVLALLGILASVLSAGTSSGGLGTASIADRVTADVVNQANLIRAKVNECQMQNLVNGTVYGTGCGGDAYPCSDQVNGTLVSGLTCPNDPLVSGAEQSLWNGARPAILPPATKGFNDWYYFNGGASGGRCIWTSPISGNSSGGNVDGLTKAASKFTSVEHAYIANNATQKFVVFITVPTGATSTPCTIP